jgi:hypothetical protein
MRAIAFVAKACDATAGVAVLCLYQTAYFQLIAARSFLTLLGTLWR